MREDFKLDREIRRSFRARVEARDGILVPGAANALAALVIADLGFEAIYLSGAGLTNTFLGLPDLGFVSLTELASHAAAIRNATDLPLVVDADTGFGNALNVRHTVRTLERAGASAIQIEDQISPKRCGHFTGKEVVTANEMADKIKAAVDARHDENLLIVARTDARAMHGFDHALERAELYSQAGADVLFIEAPQSEDEILEMARRGDMPQLINMVVGGRTPIIGRNRLREAGFALVLYANAALQGAVVGMEQALSHLRDTGSLDERGPVTSFKRRQELVRKEFYDELELRYSGKY
jgi:2-methylisocitrate lyase-like PEP mutase family enzyme